MDFRQILALLLLEKILRIFLEARFAEVSLRYNAWVAPAWKFHTATLDPT